MADAMTGPLLSGAAQAFAERAAEGRFELQRCGECGAVAWPPRDACAQCWSVRLDWAPAAPFGVVLAETTLHAMADEFFQLRAPWRIGTVKLDDGPTMFAHLGKNAHEGGRVRVLARLDYRGRGVVIAIGESEKSIEGDDRLSELLIADEAPEKRKQR